MTDDLREPASRVRYLSDGHLGSPPSDCCGPATDVKVETPLPEDGPPGTHNSEPASWPTALKFSACGPTRSGGASDRGDDANVSRG
jgi:hypothetical protein